MESGLRGMAGAAVIGDACRSMGTLKDRPSACPLNKDRFYFATDKGLIFGSDGKQWLPLKLAASTLAYDSVDPKCLGRGLPLAAGSDATLHPDGWRETSRTAGTVVAVALSLPAQFTVSGSPVTGSGTLGATLPAAMVLVDGSQAFTADQSLGSHKITNLANGTASTDAVNYSQLLAVENGTRWKDPVLVVATSNLTLSGEQTIDGVTTSASRIAVTGQSTASQNGIYTTAAGAWTRTTDLAAGDSAASVAFFVEEGTTYADTCWRCTSDPGSDVVGTNNLAFAQFGTGTSYTADETSLHLSGTTFSIKSTWAGQAAIATVGTLTTCGGINVTGSLGFACTSNGSFSAGNNLTLSSTAAATLGAGTTLGLSAGTTLSLSGANVTISSTASGDVTVNAGDSYGSQDVKIGLSYAATVQVGNATNTDSISFTVKSTGTIGGAADGQLIQNVGGVATGIELAQVCDFRCTLAAGNFVYNPQPATPSSTDTGAETVSFAAAHGWVTGTMVYVNTTAGGLTANTTYWINATSSTSVAFYTSLANAEADSSRVNLTANITSEVRPVGIQSTTLKFTPGSVGNRITLYDGTRWRMYTSAEMTLSLTATASTLYYIYCYSNSGTPTLEVSTTGTTTQDGVLVKSGATTRKLVGLAYAVATNTFEDSGGRGFYAGNRTLVSQYNRRVASMFICPGYVDGNSGTTYTSASTTYTAANGGTNATGSFVALGDDAAHFQLSATVQNDTAAAIRTGIGYDSTTDAARACVFLVTAVNSSVPCGCGYATTPTLGRHTVTILIAVASGTGSWYADTARAGSVKDPPATYIEGLVVM